MVEIGSILVVAGTVCLRKRRGLGQDGYWVFFFLVSSGKGLRNLLASEKHLKLDIIHLCIYLFIRIPMSPQDALSFCR